MNYTFDNLGRFAGLSDVATVRSTTTAPAEQSPDYNWNGAAWVYAPHVLEQPPAVTPVRVVVPQTITRAQAKLALLGAGLLNSVQPTIDAIPDPVQRSAAQIEWDDRLTFERTNPTLVALATAMGMTGEQLDALFIAAAQL